ncbi:MAG: hypothetical protein KGJ51_05420 [Acidobacteriota bacterium]|nr:hypothetical protein [Acidobacteriota bacterium]
MRKFAIRACYVTSCLLCSAAWFAGHGQTQPRQSASQAPASHKPSAVTVDVPVPAAAKAKALLPGVFSGWVLSGSATPLTDPAQADPASASALKEYDLSYGASATYKRDGDTLTVRALRFTDESGAYGAYTFYRQNGWPKEDIGAGATSNHNRVLFWQGDTVVDATFSTITPMSAAEMRSLAHQLPTPRGNKAIAPPILANLPQGSLDKQTTHYALGPAGYAGAGGVLPPSLVQFDLGAETVTANYSLSSGPATLTLIDYPTPQMAAAQEEKIRAYVKAGSQARPAWPKPLQDSDVASLEVRRSGPIVALVSGDAIPDESHKLIEMVNYQDQLTAIPLPSESEVAKTGRLLLGIATIVLIGSAAAILLGLFLGGGRALYRIARGKPASSVYETEFIRLNLEK